MAETQCTMDEKRRTRRLKVLKRGKAIYPNNRTVVDCTIRDITESGAKILCGDPAVLPNEFQLMLSQERLVRDVRVVWRRPDQVGVMFLSEARKASHNI